MALKVFSLEGKSLKFNSAADLKAHIADLRSNDVEEVKMLGNTFGVEACKLLGEVLATKRNLKVCRTHAATHARPTYSLTDVDLRSSSLPTCPTCSPAVS